MPTPKPRASRPGLADGPQAATSTTTPEARARAPRRPPPRRCSPSEPAPALPSRSRRRQGPPRPRPSRAPHGQASLMDHRRRQARPRPRRALARPSAHLNAAVDCPRLRRPSHHAFPVSRALPAHARPTHRTASPQGQATGVVLHDHDQGARSRAPPPASTPLWSVRARAGPPSSLSPSPGPSPPTPEPRASRPGLADGPQATFPQAATRHSLYVRNALNYCYVHAPLCRSLQLRSLTLVVNSGSTFPHSRPASSNFFARAAMMYVSTTALRSRTNARHSTTRALVIMPPAAAGHR
jgi:hypothetical protein